MTEAGFLRVSKSNLDIGKAASCKGGFPISDRGELWVGGDGEGGLEGKEKQSGQAASCKREARKGSTQASISDGT